MLKPALVYVLPVFAVAFLLGALRVTLVAPRIGPLAAVALELPLVLALSWVVAGRVLRRWPHAPRLGPAINRVHCTMDVASGRPEAEILIGERRKCRQQRQGQCKSLHLRILFLKRVDGRSLATGSPPGQ